MTEQTAAVEVWARMLCAADVHVNDGDHPTWQQLAAMPGRGQDEYRKAARWLLSRLSVGQTAAPSAPADRGAPGMYYCDDCDHAFTAPTDTESCICSCGARAWQEKPADADLHTRIRGVIRDCPALYPDDIADRVLAALQSAYRRLLARLEADRASHLRAAGRATGEVLRIDGAVSASALRHAAAMAVHAFEGPDAAQAYMRRTEGGEEVADEVDLRDRIAREARTIPIRLGPNALAMAQRGEPIILNMNEADAFAEALAPVLPAPADRTAIYREVAEELAGIDFHPNAKSQNLELCRLLAGRFRRKADEVESMADEAKGAAHRPHRGDVFERWLKAQRDAAADYPQAYQAADGLLDLYRLHADTGTLLDQHVCEGQAVGDCDCLEQPADVARQADTAGEA